MLHEKYVLATLRTSCNSKKYSRDSDLRFRVPAFNSPVASEQATDPAGYSPPIPIPTRNRYAVIAANKPEELPPAPYAPAPRAAKIMRMTVETRREFLRDHLSEVSGVNEEVSDSFFQDVSTIVPKISSLSPALPRQILEILHPTYSRKSIARPLYQRTQWRRRSLWHLTLSRHRRRLC